MNAILWRIPLLALLLLAAALPASAACERLQVTDGELWSANGEARRVVVRDPRGVGAPAWSPGGEEIAYGREADFALDALPEVVVVDRRGRKLTTLALPEESPVNAILKVGWRDQERVWAVGHVNPSTSVYLEWDVESGKLLAKEPGSHFTVSPDGRSVAYLENVPHGAPAPFNASTLIIDGKPVWPRDDRYHRVGSTLAWSPDSRRVAFIDDVGEGTEVVMLDEGGKVLSNARLELEDEPRLLGWLGDVVMIVRGDDEAIRVTTTGVVEETDLAPREIQLRIEGERCRPLKR
jgi:hypothetical protein